MPSPKPDDPDLCDASGTEVDDFDPDRIWHRCPGCGRLIAATRGGRFFHHVSDQRRVPRGDADRESLDAAGMNSRSHFETPR